MIAQPIFTLGQPGPLAEVFKRRRLPSGSALIAFAVAGGLMSFGPSRADTFLRVVSFVDRVLKGAAPGSLPVEEPTLYELIFNMATARAIGITIAPAMLRRADEVIR